MVLHRQTIVELRDVVGGDDADLIELIEAFLDEAPELAEALKTAAGAQDSRALKRAAHSLKSNTRDFGADRASRMFAELEAVGARGDAVSTEAVTAAVAELTEVLAELDRIREAGTI